MAAMAEAERVAWPAAERRLGLARRDCDEDGAEDDRLDEFGRDELVGETAAEVQEDMIDALVERDAPLSVFTGPAGEAIVDVGKVKVGQAWANVAILDVSQMRRVAARPRHLLVERVHVKVARSCDDVVKQSRISLLNSVSIVFAVALQALSLLRPRLLSGGLMEPAIGDGAGSLLVDGDAERADVAVGGPGLHCLKLAESPPKLVLTRLPAMLTPVPA